jgi:HK97 family phage prohead protease
LSDEFTLDVTEILEVRSEEERIIEGRIVPYGIPIEHSRGTEQFALGAFSEVHPEDIPLLWHHDPREPIGRMTGIVERDDGAYGTFKVADTARGRDYMALVREKVVAGLSIGFNPGSWDTAKNGTRTHKRVDLREVSAVTYPAYAGAQVTAVREREEHPTMPDEQPVAEATPITTDAEETPVEVRMADLDEIRDAIREVRAELGTPTRTTDEGPSGLDVFSYMVALAAKAEIPAELRAIADVVSDLGTNDASGLTPDYYWAAGLKENADRSRPLFASAGAAQFPAYGNSLVTGKVTQEPTGQSGTPQKAVLTTTALRVGAVEFPIVWHKIALDIAIELAEQGNPDAIGVASRAMLRWYAKATDVDAATKAQAAAANTGTAFSSLTDLAAIAGALVAAGQTIEDETGLFGDIVALSPENFGAFLAMTGASGPWDSDTPRDLTLRSISWAGFRIFRDPNVTEALQYNSESFRVGEKNPIAVAATNVEKMGYDRGYIGATVVDLWAEGIVEHAATV